MKYFSPFLRSVSVITPCLATLALAMGCSSDGHQFAPNGGATSAGGSDLTGVDKGLAAMLLWGAMPR